ncbi:SDR family NAD(P)-dependent oxidoreductase [uncultured Sphingomonas sp.]|uniref:SDR family NAD(P)-dependent oxidoreductase n=1 Tax=uncultured Sphingomonas sp. TaxID=158754 RepID=UPI0025D8AD00|nr:SDR family NAD(P)-dependent oxidoreductase [uncultured Sphingomonas sp.]
MKPLEGSHIALTGAAGGLGSLLARRFWSAGARITGIDRTEPEKCHAAIAADLSDPEGLAGLADELASRRVDILVNVAGVQYFGPIEEQGADRLRLGYAVNLIAPAVLSAAVVPQMRLRGDGQIVNIGSMMGAVPYPYFTAYSSAKAGLKGFSQALRREVAGSGIAVTHVAPRAMRTPLNTEAIQRFMAATKMHADDPDWVAGRILSAIERRAGDVSVGIAERLFAQLNAIAPRLIDRGIAGQVDAARALFRPSPTGAPS